MRSSQISRIIGKQLELARQSLGLEREEVAKRLGIDELDLEKWEKGDKEPTAERLIELAKLYSRDLDYFLTEVSSLPERIAFRLPQAQSIDRLPLATRQTIVRFDELCRALSELEELLGKPRRISVKTVPGAADPEDLANRERQRLSLGDSPIGGLQRLRELLEKQGITIFELEVPDKAFSGLSWWHSKYGPCILTNYGDSDVRRAFTMCHEYAHLLTDHGPSVCDPRAEDGFDLEETLEERLANGFAAAFLMPAWDLEREFRSRGLPEASVTEKQLPLLARRYGVSLPALCFRLERLGLLPRGFTNTRKPDLLLWWERHKPVPRAKGPPPPKYVRQLGKRFVSLSFRAYSEGLISLSVLARYFNVDMGDLLRTLPGREVSNNP